MLPLPVAPTAFVPVLLLLPFLIAASEARAGKSQSHSMPPGVERTGDVAADDYYASAFRHEQGLGKPRDMKRALVLYCKAAERGHAGAAYTVGWMLLNGRGVPADEGEAAAWLTLAAQGGSAAAAGALRLMPSVQATPRKSCRRTEPRTPSAAVADLRRSAPPSVRRLVAEIAPQHGLDPDLVLAVIAVESAFNDRAVSHANARGLMQLMPATAQRFAVEDVFDPHQNVRGGVQYLAWLMDRFGGDLDKVLAAYNAGEKTVDDYGGIPPYRETQGYVAKIRRIYAPSETP